MLESSAGILQGFVEVALSPIKAAAKVRAKAHAARCHATSSARRLGALKVTAAIGRCGGPSQTIWVEVLRRRQDWALLYGKTRRYQRLGRRMCCPQTRSSPSSSSGSGSCSGSPAPIWLYH